MPKCVKTLKWQCGHCKETYEHKPDAVDCEERCRKKKEAQKFIEYFPVSHEKDCLAFEHCVSCGEKVVQYAVGIGGPDGAERMHETSRGSFGLPKYRTLFDGKYCYKCFDKMKKKFLELMKNDKAKKD